MKNELGPWMPGKIKPVRKGVYETVVEGWTHGRTYQFWTGEHWLHFCRSPKTANYRIWGEVDISLRSQSPEWRGLAKKP